MTKHRAAIYRTTGCIEPAPYGLFDDEYHLTTTSGSQFHLWSEEVNHLFSAIHQFQWQRKLVPLPELHIVTEWNTLKGVFDSKSVPTILNEISRLIGALRVLQDNYADYESTGKQHGYAAMSVEDLDALIAFLSNAEVCGDSVTITEH